MSGKEIRSSIRGVCDALMGRDAEKVLTFFTEDATLVWGPYTFEDRQGVKRWIRGLREIFPIVQLRTMSLRIKGNRATQIFNLEIVMPNEKMGWLPCKAEYDFRHEKIQRVKFTLSYGYIIVK